MISGMAARVRSSKTLAIVTLLGVATMVVSGCGVKGPLEPPPEAKATGQAKSAEAADPGKNSDAPPKPHESFILDPLLR